jgi:hypothetical protein
MSDYSDKMTFEERARHANLQDRLEATNRAIIRLGVERHDLTRRLEARQLEARRLANNRQGVVPPRGGWASRLRCKRCSKRA